jgi:hypothetical protein
MMQVAALKQQLAAKTTDAEILSRRVGAVNSLTTAFEQVTGSPTGAAGGGVY